MQKVTVMLLLKRVLPLFFFMGTKEAVSQNSFAACIEKNITTGSEHDLNTLVNRMIEILPDKTFYLIGEAHTYLANNDLQLSLIYSLHRRKVYNIVNELPHATCFLFNEYLETGNDSLLTAIKPTATYELLQKVRIFNQMLPAGQRIKYYGIDYLDSKYDYDNFLISLAIIREKVPSKNLALDILLDSIILKDRLEDSEMININNTLFKTLQSDRLLYQQHFGIYYNDLLLMASNMVGYRRNRDADIFKSFLVLYEQLKSVQKNEPKFFSFYGIGHMDNLGNILLKSNQSPVKNNVVKIGILYVNCWGGWTIPSLRDDGIFELKKSNLKDFIGYCKQQKWKVATFNNLECFEFKGKRSNDAIIVFNNYGNRKMNSWKFD
ncbi:hypothetical protein [Gynurincola endophyticus]|uniref:hypothetical protein n=1 Tax=Gynurincola endophyticus TaxID=2479004 RepID=UPI000F8DF25B|nr:hypothetical protein [Gynurincola endophyticus]